ncbi:Hypothetical predicted protein [Lecanosticta acicola]|uniref:Uncharacterized protein n=1 Tax=Lecanosticta acicola TaxID=111012 RepID=A0AAI8YYE0_9PEZI|nr:Hypothetical predicted protein [Lecanosticta acicola]
MGAPTTATETQQRPMVLSADKRKISYRSKNGNLFTLELKNSKAEDSLRSLKKKYDSKIPQDVPNGEDAAKDNGSTLWPGLYDTIAMLIEESLEVACFGPYDEPPK